MRERERIPSEGVLNCWNDDHDLPDLLLSVSRSGGTGRLQFSNPEGDKTLYFKDGKIAFAESSSQDDGLGQFLLRTGKISLMDYTRVAKRIEPKKRLGTLLVEEGVLDASELAPAIFGQVRAIALGLFRRTETWYAFKEMKTPLGESITMDLPVAAVILGGVRFVESWRRISKGVGPLDSIYESAKRDIGVKLEPSVRELLDMMAEPVTLEDICTRASLPDFEACRYLWAFRSLGWIERVADDDVAVTKAVSVPEATKARPAPSSQPVAPPSIPERLIETQIAMDRPAPPPPSPKLPPAIPEELLHTQMYIEPPAASDNAAPPLPKSEPVPEHLARTQLSVEPPPPKPEPIPESLVQTQLSVKPPSPAPEPELPPQVPEELLHTQMFLDPEVPPPPKEPPSPPPPPSTSELMESILEGDSPEETDPARAVSADGSRTQFFDGPSALPIKEEPPFVSSGLEALAKNDDPGSPADTPTLPAVKPPKASLTREPGVDPKRPQKPRSNE